MPDRLAAAFPHHIHVEESAFTHPTYQAEQQMYGTQFYNYTNNYSIHLYIQAKQHFIPGNEEELRGYNCTLGRVMRDVLYGSPQLLDSEHVKVGIL